MKFLIVVILLQASFVNGIEILTERKIVRCGTKYTLTCKVEKYATLVAWMFEGDILPIARCLRNACRLTPNYVEKYKLDKNVDEGFYSLTIMKLSIDENGITFVCTTGYESVSKTLLFKDYRALLFEDAENDIITASSGFISPDTKVIIKWTKINAYDGHESDFNEHIINTTANMYQNNSLCSSNQLMQHSVTISAEPSESGKHYLKIAVTYGNETLISNLTTLKYNVVEQDLSNGIELDHRKEDQIILVIIIPVVLIVISAMVVVICVNKHRCGGLSTNNYLCMKKSRVF